MLFVCRNVMCRVLPHAPPRLEHRAREAFQRKINRQRRNSARVRPYFPQPRFAGGANIRFVCLSVRLCVRATSQIWEGQFRALCSFERRQPKFLHRPKRLRCDSDPAGAARTPQIAPPTRAPAGRRPTDARHSRHARLRSHHGHRSATVTPESLQADVGPWTRLRGDGRRECFDLSEAEWEVQARSVRSEQRDAKGRALQSSGEGDCERSWL